MKATIDNETKAKFFAQYWGLPVLHLGGMSVHVPVDQHYMSYVRDGNPSRLELKPLSSISDEDAIEVGVLSGYNPEAWEYTGRHINRGLMQFMHKKMKNVQYVFASMERPRQSMNYACVDFLRSRGYLLSWMGLSVEEIIKAGWAKYKEQ